MSPESDAQVERSGIAVVTGGASGIGLALARAYLGRGLRVLIADLKEERLKEAADDLDRGAGGVSWQVTDVVSEPAVDELVARACELGPITAVCMNAGVTAFGPATWDTSQSSFLGVMNVNLGGLFNSIRGFVPVLKTQETKSAIVITASMAGLVASPYSAVYAASKAAAVAMARALRGELEAEASHVAVTLLAPGAVQTNLFHSSTAVLTDGPSVDSEMAEAAHLVLQEQGIPAAEAASWALTASDEGRFWALPPAGDPFCELLGVEIDQLRDLVEQ
jgi:NAD(P)-dependent dehydrogenase (short-subunit alcohol dehydrogenase family)